MSLSFCYLFYNLITYLYVDRIKHLKDIIFLVHVIKILINNRALIDFYRHNQLFIVLHTVSESEVNEFNQFIKCTLGIELLGARKQGSCCISVIHRAVLST